MDIRQLREWGKRLFGSISANTKKAIAGVISAAMIVTVALVAIPAQAAGNMIADPTTFTQWEQGIGEPTDPRSTGRVWTDKSVSTQEVTLKTYDDNHVTVAPKDGSFLVGLSAMSSAQKLIGVSNVTKPLDIVLVLDTSGSMAWGMDGDDEYAYDPVYAADITTSKRYYVRVSGSMTRVYSSANGWYYDAGGSRHYVTPKTSAADSDAAHTQFYSRRRLTTQDTRMYALKQAVNGFIDQTIAANAKVSDPNKKNRIGLVTYASDVNTRSGLTDSLSGLKSTVDDLKASGATRADLGMQTANTVLGNARADASKIVIFFTDGQPTKSNGFENDVANDAIGAAKTMKTNGASVYSVGIFTGANPDANVSSVTGKSDIELKSNAFMQGVSSNYPNATTYTNLGAKAPNSNYYLAASDADTLNAVFNTIWSEVSSNPTSPIQAESQDGTTGERKGAVTFTDQLGDYMTVTSMNSVIFAGTKFAFDPDAENAVVKNGNTTTYTFHGEVAGNEVYKAANLQDLKITVTDNGEKTGDTVRVEVPADLLPLRLYTAKVDKDGNVTTSIARTHPIRLFYDVALKDGVRDKVAKPDAAMSQYIAQHTDASGDVYFLTNAYDTSAQPAAANGTTTAVFTPATTNDFYYFTQDTPLYNSKNLEDPAKSIENSVTKTYYYQRTYYANNAKHEQWIDVLGSNAYGKAVADSKGNYYAPAGTERTGLSRLYTAPKKPNTTNTASNAIAPEWQMNNVTVRLGNNGKQTLAGVGTLHVTEKVVWPQGAKRDPNKSFPFTLQLEGTGADGEFQAVIAGEGMTVTNGQTFELKDGESVTVYGLTPGLKATVEQTNHGGAGWSVNHANDSGTIEKNKTTNLDFVNTYALTPTTLATGSIKGEKVLANRDWQPGEEFTFTISPLGENSKNPLPNPATVSVKNNGSYKAGQPYPFSFGGIEYSNPGTYQYVISENPGDKAGMQYSGASYTATVTVEDNGNGTMTASVNMKKTYNDQYEAVNPAEPTDYARFTNRFLGKNESAPIVNGYKNYTDQTGGNPNEDGKFKVIITAGNNPDNGPAVPTQPVDVKADGTWSWNPTFTNAALNGQTSQTFTYHVREDVPTGASPTLNGMTYDLNTYDVTITVSRDSNQDLITTVGYPNGAKRIEFTNTYKATPTQPQTLQVEKKVTGRDAEARKFTFEAKLDSGDANNVKINNNDTLTNWDTMTVKTPEIKNGNTTDINFEGIVFTKPGTYTFGISEQIPNPVPAGWTYDTHTHTVTYEVTDNNGQLEARRNTDGNDLFTNAYAASVDYGAEGTADGFRIGKTLTGRSMNAGEFGFIIEPQNGAPMPGGAAHATTTNPFSAVSGQELVWPANGTLLAGLRFTQDDAGKTYEYTVREVPPEDVTQESPTKNGVTYD
ncbi:Spy0128 family protein, partial [Bifidobacterium animalis]